MISDKTGEARGWKFRTDTAWVAVKELKFNYFHKETLVFITIYT